MSVYVSERREGIDKKIRRELLGEDAECAYCGAKAHEIDHVVPVVAGGTNARGNLVAACERCNREKSSWLVEEWKTQRLALGHCWPPRSMYTGSSVISEACDIASMLADPEDLLVPPGSPFGPPFGAAFRNGASPSELARMLVGARS